MFNLYGRFEAVVAEAEPVPGPTSDLLAQLARELEIVLVGGSIAERDPNGVQARNTSLVFAADGQLLAGYCKVHLFDIDLPGRVTSRESDWIVPGCDVSVYQTPLGKLGQAICYDLRFPELFRRLSAEGCELIAVPSAFTKTTGRDHWQVLVRARAIENQCFVLAPNQFGQHAPGMTSYGHSMIVDPWGHVLASLVGDSEGFAIAEIDLDLVASVRAQLPALAHRRL
jgi:predicted amidohydrolase